MDKSQNQSKEEIMDRVNQTFEKLTQDVKEMINQNDQENNDQYS